jgi:hypothetical protein
MLAIGGGWLSSIPNRLRIIERFPGDGKSQQTNGRSNSAPFLDSLIVRSFRWRQIAPAPWRRNGGSADSSLPIYPCLGISIALQFDDSKWAASRLHIISGNFRTDQKLRSN